MSTSRKNPDSARQGAKASPKPLSAEQIRRGLLAGLAAWVFPGAGHWLAGARKRAAAYAGLVFFSLAMGLVFDGNFPLVDSRTPVISRLEVAASLALGPAEPILRSLLYGAPVFVNREDSGRPAPQAGPLEIRRRRSFAKWSNYGSAYLLTAGLMNILLILEAWDLGLGRKR